MSKFGRYLRQYKMMMRRENGKKIGRARVGLLFCVFFLIAAGLGYPVLNRFDPRQTPGLSDVKTYAAVVSGTDGFGSEDLRFRRFRVLVPWLARPFYWLARGRFATWDPVMFGLLVADSLFVAGTAVLMVILGSLRLGSGGAGLVGALLYLVNFAVPNLRLVGLVDAGEGFFLLALLSSLSEFKLWALPVIAVLGALTKETFVFFVVIFTATWWITPGHDWSRRSNDAQQSNGKHFPDAAWIVTSWLLGVGAMSILQWSVTGMFVSPLQFGVDLHQRGGYHFAVSLQDRNLLYIFVWLLPTAIPNLKLFPKEWLIPMGATCATAFVLDAYFGGAPGTLGRVLFSLAGPVLSLSSALFLLRMCSPTIKIRDRPHYDEG